MQDAVLLLGNEDEKLKRFLARLGYLILQLDSTTTLPQFLSERSVDIILVDGRTDFDCVALCDYLRREDLTKRVPILYLGENGAQVAQLKDEGYDRIEILTAPISPGLVMSRIATQLRVGKLSGLTDKNASLSEVLAAQRDLHEKLKRELEQARNIQQSLLPTELPKDPRFEVVATYRPLDEVGGDVYFVARQSDGRILLHVADVTGHGMSAALIGSMTRLAFAVSPAVSTAEHLAGMNRLLTPLLPSGTFVTGVSCLYDPQTHRVDFSRAGHPAVLRTRVQQGTVARICPDGFPLGFMDDSSYDAVQDELELGDALVIYTDGLTEAQNRGFECYGEERLQQSIRNAAKASSAQQMLEAIMSDFEKFIDGRRLKDDVTLMVLRRSQ